MQRKSKKRSCFIYEFQCFFYLYLHKVKVFLRGGESRLNTSKVNDL